jgi:hypothetical protein
MPLASARNLGRYKRGPQLAASGQLYVILKSYDHECMLEYTLLCTVVEQFQAPAQGKRSRQNKLTIF